MKKWRGIHIVAIALAILMAGTITSYASYEKGVKLVEEEESFDEIDGPLMEYEYPVNAKGETYGSASYFSIVGEDPDLIAAVGVNGERGYIRREDESPSAGFTYEEVLAYIEHQGERREIPVYDLDGNVIDTFVIEGAYEQGA